MYESCEFKLLSFFIWIRIELKSKYSILSITTTKHMCQSEMENIFTLNKFISNKLQLSNKNKRIANKISANKIFSQNLPLNFFP